MLAKNLKATLLTLLLVGIFNTGILISAVRGQTIGPDAYGYTAVQTTYAFEDISNTNATGSTGCSQSARRRGDNCPDGVFIQILWEHLLVYFIHTKRFNDFWGYRYRHRTERFTN